MTYRESLEDIGLMSDSEQLSLFPVEPAPPLSNPCPHPQLRLGTASWSFPGWRSIVYAHAESQQRLAQEGLAAYASHPLLRAVALDRCFYAPLSLEQYRQYASVAPDDFRFLVKAPAELVRPTSRHYLDAEHARRVFVEPALEGLGSKLGTLHFFFPPGQPAFQARLQSFLQELGDAPVSCEVRQPELLTPSYWDALGHAVHCWNIYPGMARPQPTGGRLRLVRWTLRDNPPPWNLREAALRYLPFTRLQEEDPATRLLLAEHISAWLGAGESVLVLANNKAEGCAPLTLQKLAAEVNRISGSGVSESTGGESLPRKV